MIDHISIIAIAIPVIGFLLSLTALLIVPRNRKPTAGMAWLLVIFLLPYIGWLFFFLLGTNKLPKKRRDSQRALDKLIDIRVKGLSAVNTGNVPEKFRSLASLATALGHLPPLYGETTKFITDYDKALASIAKDIRTADTSVYLEYFIVTYDETTKDVFEALKEAAAKGVEVRVLFDWWSSFKLKTYRRTLAFMKEHGIVYQAMLPPHFSFKEYLRIDLRNHRKLVIIDHEIGYVGSQNLIRRDYNRRDTIVYDELVVRLTGTIINELKALFAYDWYVETSQPLHHVLNDTLAEDNHDGASLLQILPSGPSYNDENNLKVFTYAINRAEHEVFIANPYFVPAEPLLSAIITAAKRGVKIRMVNSEVMDQVMVGHAQRSYYEELLTAGVEVFLYKKPTLLHSKFMIIDNEIAIVGSSNMDIRSFELDQELSLIMYDKKHIYKLMEIRDMYLERSNRVILKHWKKRTVRVKLLDSIARLTSNIQ